jgi:hypothetical protein
MEGAGMTDRFIRITTALAVATVAAVAAVISYRHAYVIAEHEAPLALTSTPSLHQTIRAMHANGYSQRGIAGELHVNRRKVKRILDQAA